MLPLTLGARVTRVAWATVRECHRSVRPRGGDGWRGASPARGGPRRRGALVLLHLNMQRNSGGIRAGLGRVWVEVQFWPGGVQSPCKGAGLHLRQQRIEAAVM